MSDRLVALHGFLGQGKDWDAVRAATQTPLAWVCPDLFAPNGPELWRKQPEFDGKSWLVGYSFGARLALRWLVEEPGHWHGALLLSVNPGNFLADEERAARRKSDLALADALRVMPWDELMKRWNAQEIFAGDVGPVRMETDFDRAKLSAAMEEFSVADQFTAPSRLATDIVWLAGEKDTKFSALSERMREAGFPGHFFTVPAAGHRLLSEAPDVIASALDGLVGSKP
jgi:2-succinyl-6-hydroxy-2,4-cyclohexadiene-1-carboxylate synthase